MKNSYLIFLTFIFQTSAIMAQIHKDCEPERYLSTRTNVTDQRLNAAPYDRIVHFKARTWGTATFVNDSTLITARHMTNKRLNTITFYKNSFQGGKVISKKVHITKDDYQVRNFDDNCNFFSGDISIIKLKPSGRIKLTPLFSGGMNIADFRTLGLDPGTVITLTGYPVDLAGADTNAEDILADKKTTIGDLVIECDLAGYKIFTCSGDSGAPLWVSKNNAFYLIGIHHGGPEEGTVFAEEERNTASLINSKVLDFINQ